MFKFLIISIALFIYCENFCIAFSKSNLMPRIRRNQIKCYVQQLNNTVQEVIPTTDWNIFNCKTVAIILHGNRENYTEAWIKQLQQVYITQLATCAVACDYNYSSTSDYFHAINRGDDFTISSYIAEIIVYSIADKGQRNISRDVELVGFSRGGQISGLIGKEVNERIEKKIARITALDPAGIPYDSLPDSHHLTPNDALCVVVYKCSTLGSNIRYLGKRNIFFGNCGINQRSICQSNFVMDHSICRDYFIEAMINESEYEGIKCTLCPYGLPTDPYYTHNAEVAFCDTNNTFPIITDSCQSEILYILPDECPPRIF